MLIRKTVHGRFSVRKNAALAAAVAGLGLLALQAPAAQWSAAPVSGDWSNAANWDFSPPTEFDNFLFFDNSTITTLNNNLSANTVIGAITFNNGAPGYTLNGNTINLGTTGLFNFSTSAHVINTNLVLAGATVFDTGFSDTGSITLNGSVTGTGGILKDGLSTLIVNGTTGYNGTTQIRNGTLLLTGMIDTAGGGGARTIVGNMSGQAGVLVVDGGVYQADAGSPGMVIASSANSVGAVYLMSGRIAINGELWVSAGANSSGYLEINGGTLTTTSFLDPARGAAPNQTNMRGQVTVNDGVLSVGSNRFEIGGFQGTPTAHQLTGVVTINGGTVTAPVIAAGNSMDGVLTITGGIVTTTAGGGIESGVNANAWGQVNLKGGTLTTARIFHGTAGGSRSIVNFDGTVIRPTTTGNLILQHDAAYVWDGGLIIDSGTQATLSVSQRLLAPTGSGVTADGLTVGGTGFVAPPIVEITGDGVGATAVATIDTAGNLTSVIITNPGVGYTAIPSFEFIGGGGFGFATGGGLAANTGGGLTKLGTGVLTMSGSSGGTGTTYTGPTSIEGGLTLAYNTTGAPLTNMISTAALSLNNGVALTMLGANGSANSQTFASTTLNGAGGYAVTVTPGTGTASTFTLALGALTRTGAGASMNIAATSSQATLTTSTANASYPGGSATILDGYVTFNGSTWATVSGGTISGLSTYNAGFAAGTNVDVADGPVNVASMTVNSIRFNSGAGAVTLNGPLTVATGGILVTADTGTNSQSITGSTITSGNGRDLIVHDYSTQANSLTVGSQIVGAIGLTKAGPGTLILTHTANTYTGKTYINGGKVFVAADASLGAAPGAPVADQLRFDGGTLALSAAINLATNRGITVATRGGALDTNGFDSVYGGLISGPGTFTKAGAGELTLTSDQNFAGPVAVIGGNLDLPNSNVFNASFNVTNGSALVSGSANVTGVTTVGTSTLTITGVYTTAAATTSQITVGAVETGNGALGQSMLIIDGGTLTAGKTSSPSILVGSANNAHAILKMNSGVLTSISELHLGASGNNRFGALTQAGGTVSVGSYFVVGFNSARAVFNLHGGSFSVSDVFNSSFMTIGAGGTNAFGVVNLHNGTFVGNGTGNGVRSVYVGEGGTGILNLLGDVSMTLAGRIGLGSSTASTGIVNLNAGSLTTTRVNTGNAGANSIFNFDGGVLRAAEGAGTGTFMTGLRNAYIWSGNANIDTQAFAITIGQALLAPTATTGIVSTIAVVNGGSGYTEAPSVTVSGDQGATATAIIEAGVVTSIVVNTPGYGYSAAPTVTIAAAPEGGTTATATASLGAAAANKGVVSIPVTNGGSGYLDTPVVMITGGGGSGASAIANVSTSGVVTSITLVNPGVGYTAAPSVTLFGGGGSGATAGTPTLNENVLTGGLNKYGTGTLTLTNSSSTYLGATNVIEGLLQVNAELSSTSGVNVSSGAAFGGNGTISAPVVVAGGGAIDLRTGTSNTLTLNGGLTLGSAGEAASLFFDFGGLGTTSDMLVVNGADALVVNAGGAKVFLTNLGSALPGDAFTLMNYDSTVAPNITLDPSSVFLGFLNATLNVSTTAITVNIGGAPIPADAWWTGQFDEVWSTASAGNGNWNTSQAGGVNAQQIPGPTSNVFFATTTPTPANLTTTLGQGFSVLSITTKSGTGAVTINAAPNDLLTIGSGGITTEAGSGGLTINANVNLLDAQTWTNQGAAELLTVNGVISGEDAAGLSISGEVHLNAANTFTGGTTINSGGTLTVGSATSLASGALSFGAGSGLLRLNGLGQTIRDLNGTGAGVIENGSNTNVTLTFNSSTTTSSFSGMIQNGTGTGTIALLVTGGGKLTLLGQNSYTGATTVNQGTLTLGPGSQIRTDGTAEVVVGNAANNIAVMEINGGVIDAQGNNGTISMRVGQAANSFGVVKMTGGTITSNQQWFLGRGNNTSGANTYSGMTMSGGLITVGSWMGIAFNNDRSVFNQTGGTISVTANNLTIAAGSNSNGIGRYNLSGGSLLSPGGMQVGEFGDAIFTMSGTAQVTLGGGLGMTLNTNGASNGLGRANLNGGTLTTTEISQSVAGGIVNMHGTYINVNTTPNNPYFFGVSQAIVWNEGVVFDDVGTTINITQAFSSPTGNGIGVLNSTIAVAGGTGYLETPVIVISGGGGTGATANAVLTGGQLTGIQVTNPGTGYTAPPTVTFFGGGGTTPNFTGITLLDNSTLPNGGVGNITKRGSGTMNLTGNSANFAGQFIVDEGTLVVNNNNNLGNTALAQTLVLNGGTLQSVNNLTLATGTSNRDISTTALGGSINVDAFRTLTIPGALTGSGALNLVGAGTLALTGTSTFNNAINVNNGKLHVSGQLGGTGSVVVNTGGGLGGTGTVSKTVSVTAGGAIDLGDANPAGTLTLSNGLTIDGGSIIFDAGGTSIDHLNLGGSALTVGGGGATLAYNNSGIAPGVYTLMTYTNGAAPVGINGPAMIGGSTASYSITASSITVTLNGAPVPTTAFWSGDVDDNWLAVTTVAGVNTNFNTSAAGGIDTEQTPGAITNVVFATTTPLGANLDTVLGGNLTVNSIAVSAGTAAVSIGDSNNTLTIASGISLASGSNGLTITANVALGGNQDWDNLSAGGSLTVSGVITGNAGLSLGGLVTLSAANLYTGGTTIKNGTITMGSATALGSGALAFSPGSNPILRTNGTLAVVGGLSGDSTAVIENSSEAAANGRIEVASAAVSNFAGTLRDGSGGTLNLRVSGGGTLNLSGPLTFTGGITVRDAALNLGSQVNITTASPILFGDTATSRARVTMDGGTLAGSNGTAAIILGSASTGQGSFYLNGGVVSTTNELWLGTLDGRYGHMTINGGSVTTGSWLAVARGGGQGVLNVHGGELNINGFPFTVGSFGGSADQLHAVVTLTGGTVNANQNMFVAEGNRGVVTVAGTAVLNVSNNGAGNNGVNGIGLGNGANASGFLNLNGGTVTTPRVMEGAGADKTSIVNFNGGVLRISADSPNTADFFTGLDFAYVWSGNAIFDDNGLDVTTLEGLLAPTGSGVSAIPVLVAGVDYIGPPVVEIVGGGGFGATADAIVDSSGNLTGFNITNPGVDYTAAPDIILRGGGSTAPVLGTVALASYASGGLVKLGAGTLTVASPLNSITGQGSINGGLLNITGNGTSNTLSGFSGPGNLTIATGALVATGGITITGTWTINGAQSIRLNAGDAGTSKVSALPTIDAAGSLDLTNNILIVQSSNASDKTAKITALNDLIAAGATGGITSATVAADPATFAVGIFDNAALGEATMGGQSVDASSIIVAYAHQGDANRSGVVDIVDLAIVANNWQAGRNNWAQGDLNGSGIVDIVDLAIVANNWQESTSYGAAAASFPQIVSAAGAAVPEPASLAVLALGGAALLARRRRR